MAPAATARDGSRPGRRGTLPPAGSAVTSRCRSTDSRRTAASKCVRGAIADPARCQRDRDRRRHHCRGPHRGGEQPAGADIGRHDIGDPQSGAEAFGEAGDMPGDVRSQRRKRRRAVDRQKSIRIVFDNSNTEAARDGGDVDPPLLRDRVRGRIEQRRIEIERLAAKAACRHRRMRRPRHPRRPSAGRRVAAPSCAAIERAPG